MNVFYINIKGSDMIFIFYFFRNYCIKKYKFNDYFFFKVLLFFFNIYK